MNKEIARYAVRTVFKSLGQINELIPVLQQNCTNEEYQILGRAIASLNGQANIELLNKIYKMAPDLEQDIGTSIDKYGIIL